ncbi:MAG TPA: YdcF family protein [Actinomycetota bacterium]
MKRITGITALVLVLLLAYPGWLALRIWQQSRDDEQHSADAIVVLGAAQYNGDPSPIFEARLDHAAFLYDLGMSETVIVTGGKQPGDNFTEAQAGNRYLTESKDVPVDAIVEVGGNTTWESLQEVADVAEDERVESLLLVSDPLHGYRIKTMARDLGFEEAYASPASYLNVNRSRLTKAKELVHEVASMLNYAIIEGR